MLCDIIGTTNLIINKKRTIAIIYTVITLNSLDFFLMSLTFLYTFSIFFDGKYNKYAIIIPITNGIIILKKFDIQSFISK